MRRTLLVATLTAPLALLGACGKDAPAPTSETPGAMAQALEAPPAPTSPAGGAASGALPAGHPPIGGAATPPPGPVDPSAPLPPGHPPIGGGAAPAPAPGGAAGGDEVAAGPIDVGGVHLVPPGPWMPERPASSMRLAQYRLPPAAGDTAPAVVTVIVAGGDAQSNITRWVGQFEGSPEPRVESWDAGGRKVTLVRIAGAFAQPNMQMNGPAGPATPGMVMLALIVPTDDGQSVFVKGTGPEATMNAAELGFRALVASPVKGGE
ncbi:MAG: hypothetical protein H6745_32235 [Deltaproteobacteria bacterium]|nr:hypothetical protein [Deltaproteobacteria bacterium]